MTSDEVRALSRKVIQSYRDAMKTLSVQVKDMYSQLAGVDPKDYYNTLIKYNRLKTLLESVKASYIDYSKQAQRYIEAASYVAMENTYYRQMYVLSWAGELTVGALPPQLAELTIYGTDKSWKAITQKIIDKYGSLANYKPKAGTLMSFIAKNRTNEINKIQSVITSGLLRGQSYPQMEKALRKIIGEEMKVAGKINITGAKYNGLRILRTETNRTMNAGHYAASKYADSQGLEIKRRMVATLDSRTRNQSAYMDGKEVGIDEPFTYPNGATAIYPGSTGVAAYDINDRETVIDIVPGFEPVARLGRNPVTGENEVLSNKYFDEWAKSNGLRKNVYGEIYTPEGK